MNTYFTPYLQLRNSSLIQYNQIEYLNENKSKSNKTTYKKSNSINSYLGEITIGSKKRIKKSLDMLLQSTPFQIIYNPISKRNIKFRLAFITLTISSNNYLEHSIAYSELLKPFIDWLTKTKDVTKYIWKAEIQKRGQIHYHITTTTFITHDQIRKKWNYLQKKLGLIKSNENPPSTEIKQVYKIKNIEHYLAKYISKNGKENNIINDSNNNEIHYLEEVINGNCLSCYPSTTMNDYTIYGKVWDCSRKLKINNYFTLELTAENSKTLIKNEIQNIIVEEIFTENCTILKTTENYQNQILTDNLKNQYDEFIQCVNDEIIYIPDHKRNPPEKKLTKEILEFNRIEKMFADIKLKSSKISFAPALDF